MFDEEFSARLAHLRAQKGVSARDMSLSIGQNPGYIHNIESGKALPSMSSFFFICDYLGVSPMEFFDLTSEQPAALADLIADLKQLTPDQLDHIKCIIRDLAHPRWR